MSKLIRTRRFSVPDRLAFSKDQQRVIDYLTDALNQVSVSGESRGQPETIRQAFYFTGIEQARTFFQELNINTLHAVATRTGSLTVDNLLTMSTGAQIVGENYMIEQNDIYLYSTDSSAPAFAITTGLNLQVWDGSAYQLAGNIGASYTIGTSGVGITSRTGVRLFLRAGQATPISLNDGWGLSILDDEISIMEDSGGKVGFFGVTPVLRQADDTDLKDVLVNFGFLVDGGATPLNLDGGLLTIGSIKTSYVTKTANYSASTSDHTIDCTSGTFTVTLYAASGNAGLELRIINSGSGTITVDGFGSETINGNLTETLLANDSITIVCTGSGWRIV